MAALRDRWLYAGDIDTHVGVSNDTGYRWIENHDVSTHRVGLRWEVRKGQVDAWVEAGGAAALCEKASGK